MLCAILKGVVTSISKVSSYFLNYSAVLYMNERMNKINKKPTKIGGKLTNHNADSTWGPMSLCMFQLNGIGRIRQR